MSQELERIKVLEMLKEGNISVDEAEMLLNTLGEAPLTAADDHHMVILPADDGSTRLEDLPAAGDLWVYPFGAGIGFLSLFGFVASLGGFFLTFCLSPFMLGAMGLAALGVWSRNAHWMHVRVKDHNTNLRFSLPLPTKFAGWVVSLIDPILQNHVDDANLKNLNLGELISQMGHAISQENPLVVAVDDDDSQVFVYIT